MANQLRLVWEGVELLKLVYRWRNIHKGSPSQANLWPSDMRIGVEIQLGKAKPKKKFH